jgi:hypothetical protein
MYLDLCLGLLGRIVGAASLNPAAYFGRAACEANLGVVGVHEDAGETQVAVGGGEAIIGDGDPLPRPRAHDNDGAHGGTLARSVPRLVNRVVLHFEGEGAVWRRIEPPVPIALTCNRLRRGCRTSTRRSGRRRFVGASARRVQRSQCNHQKPSWAMNRQHEAHCTSGATNRRGPFAAKNPSGPGNLRTPTRCRGTPVARKGSRSTARNTVYGIRLRRGRRISSRSLPHPAHLGLAPTRGRCAGAKSTPLPAAPPPEEAAAGSTRSRPCAGCPPAPCDCQRQHRSQGSLGKLGRLDTTMSLAASSSPW